MNLNKNLANKTILLVEDDLINLRVFTTILFLRLAHLYQPGKGKGLPSKLSEKLADLYTETVKPEPLLDILHTEDAEDVIQLNQSADVYLQKTIVDHQQFADTIQELLSKQNKRNA